MSEPTFGPVCHDGGVRGHGAMDSGVFLVGIAPGRYEERSGIPMSGPSGSLINSFLTACGWSRERTYATNVVCRRTAEDNVTENLWRACLPRLEQEIAACKPRLMVLMGRYVSDVFYGSRKFGTVRGMVDWSERYQCYMMPTYHTAALLHGMRAEGFEAVSRGIIRDFSKIKEVMEGRGLDREVNFDVVTDLAVAQRILDGLPKDRDDDNFVALDIETPFKEENPTHAVVDPITCFAITALDGNGEERTWWFPGSFAPRLSWPQDVCWTYHNGMFDTVGLAKEIGGQLLPIVHDTFLMSHCLDERKGFHGLKLLAREYHAAGFYEEHPLYSRGKLAWNNRLQDTPWAQTYNSKDAAYTRREAARMLPLLKADGMERVYRDLLLPAQAVYRKMQRRGMYVDPLRVQALLVEWAPMLQEKDARLLAIASDSGGHLTNTGSPQQVAKLLYETWDLPGGPSTDMENLEYLLLSNIPDHARAFIDGLIDVRHLRKAIGTFVIGVQDDILSTGRVHPVPNICGTVAGRCSYTNPPVNTIPRDPDHNENPYLQRCRWLFTAEDTKRCLLSLDYSQAEVWTGYYYSRDRAMLADLQTGDFHRGTAARIHMIDFDKVTGPQRSDAKRLNFGKAYGIGATKFAAVSNLQTKARPDSDRWMTIERSQAFIHAWDARYPGYIRYMQDTFKQAETAGEVVTVTGRKRRFPYVVDDSIMPQTANFPVQSTAHDYVLAAAIEADPLIESYGGHIVLDLHDALMIDVPRAVSYDVACRVADIMRKPRFGLPGIPVEAERGFDWSDLRKVALG